MAEQLEFRALGPMEVLADGNALDLGPHKQRSLLALLLANVNQVVSIDRIIDALWSETTDDKEKTVWVYVSRLRSALEPHRTSRGESSVLLTKEPGYVLAAEPSQVDYLRFEEAVAAARAALPNDAARALDLLDDALGLWHGEPFADFTYEDFLRNDLDRLRELRLEADELRYEAMLREGQSGELLTNLEIFVRKHPFRERPVGQLMVALYRSGRQAEALRVYERHRRTVGDELGIDPSPDLARIEEQILLHDPTLVLSGRDRPSLLAAQSPANPFKGLHAFGESDEATFFGRDTLVAALLRRIDQGERLIAVVGPSGSGKSSVVKAGVIPGIRKRSLPGGNHWIVADMVPGAHPFTELEAALLRAQIDGPDSLADQLASGDTAILRAGLRVLPDANSRLLLVIDQFEELFTLVEDRNQQQRFLESLLVALEDPHGRIAVVLTLRADFYDRPLLHPQFGRRLGDSVVTVTPMLTAELEEAALRPAGEAGVTLEPRLLARLLADVVGEPGALPMFQYTLTELFERQKDGLLLESIYERMGGLRGAITNRAEELYEELSPGEQAAAGQLFLRLVAMSDEETWSRRRVKASEILSLDVDVIALQSVIDRFGAHRLLFFDRDKVTGSPTVEVGHEALLYEWPRLEEWIIRARRDLLRHAALRGAVDEWERSGRDPGYLLTGTRLTETETSSATGSVQLNTRELEYIDASRTARDSAEHAEVQRLAAETRLAGSAKRRLWALVALVGVVAAIGLVIVLATGNDPVRVALIHDNDDLIGRGLDEAARRYGIEPVSITPPWVSVESVGDELAKSGTELVVMSPFDAGTAEDLAAQHPNTKFVVPFDPFDSVAPNYIRYTFAHEQVSYLAGIAAATVSESKVVGFVGAYDFIDIHESLAGFQQGVWSVDPAFEVVSAYVSRTDFPSDAAFDDVDGGHRTALELYESGIDVVYHHAERSGLGVLSAAREATAADGRHRWAIGSYSDQHFEAAAADREHILMSVIRRLDTVVLHATERLLADELIGPVYHLTMADAGLGYVDSGGKLPAGLVDILDETMSSISDGSIVVTAWRAFRPTSAVQADPTDDRFGLVGGGNSLTLAITPFSPFAEERDGVVLGFFPDLLEEVANRLVLQVTYLEAPFPDLLAGVEEGTFDIGACDCDITPERLERFLFAPPVLKSAIGLAVLPGSPISSIDQVATVTVTPAGSAEELIRTEYPEIAIEVAFGPVHPGILERGQADAWVNDVDDFAPEVEVVQILQETLQAFTVNPELTELAAALQDTMNDMIADGTYGEIYDRWFDDDGYRVDR